MSELDPQSSPPTESKVIPYGLRPKSLGSRMATWVRLWSRDTFSRDQMVSSLKSLAWVAPLTILIWVYAEREQIATVQNQTIPISIKSADPKLIVTVNPDDQNITAELSGPRVSVDKVTDELKLIPKNDQGVAIEISGAYAPGSYQILSSLVSDADLFRRAGVTITKPSPQNIHITIDRIVDRELDVQIPSDVSNLVGTPTFEPRKIRVSGPEAVLNAAAANKQLNVYADLKNFREIQTPGKHTLDNVPLMLGIPDKNVTVFPATVKANIEVRPVDIEYKKDALTIFVTYPPGFAYRAEYFPSLPNVTMYGSRQAIEDMKASPIQPKARFEVGAKDLKDLPPDVPRTARLDFDTPPGVRMSDEDKNRTVEFHLVKLPTQE